MAAALSHIQLSNRTGVPLHVGIPQGPRSQILMMRGGGGGGGVRMIFLGLKFWPKVIFFGTMKDTRIFLGHKIKPEGFFGVAKKRLRDFFGYATKRSDFLG